MQPLNMLIFGNLIDDVIEFAKAMVTSVDPDELQQASDSFFDAIKMFAIYNSLIGLVTFVTSYLSTVLFNYTALRQVSCNKYLINRYYSYLYAYFDVDVQSQNIIS